MNYEKLDNEQKGLVKYWIEKYKNHSNITKEGFTEKYLTPDTVVEVGKFYTNNNPNSLILFKCTSIRGNQVLGYGFGYDGTWRKDGTDFIDLDLTKIREVPEDIWEKRLSEEAERLGFVVGAKFNSPGEHWEFSTNQTIIKANYHYQNYKKDSYFCCTSDKNTSCIIMENGEWAEIVGHKLVVNDEILGHIERVEKELEDLKTKIYGA